MNHYNCKKCRSRVLNYVIINNFPPCQSIIRDIKETYGIGMYVTYHAKQDCLYYISKTLTKCTELLVIG